MTQRPGRDAEPWRFPPRRGGPRRDLAPAAVPLDRDDGPYPFLSVWRAQDAFNLEAIEIGAVMAEEAVRPFLSSRTGPIFRGVSVVHVRFQDEGTLSSFRRIGAVKAVRDHATWRLDRRWAPAQGDGGLDEAMCGVVARYLNDDFAALLRAEVITWVGGFR
jgi:hypothetical protein